MTIKYQTPVARCNFTIKCIPKDTVRQAISDIKMELVPKTYVNYGEDGLRNLQIYGLNEDAHDSFFFHIQGKAVTGLADYEEKAVEELAMIFAHPYGLNRPGPAIKAYYEKICTRLYKKDINSGKLVSDDMLIACDASDEAITLKKAIILNEQTLLTDLNVRNDAYAASPTRQFATALMHRLHADFRYAPGTTNVRTTAEQAFQQGCGVCQDYAHIFIALMHLAKIPARYVTGLVTGEGASHAWVEILDGDKWYGLDPTNDMLVTDNHIKIGVGRDAGDCMINRGIMHGNTRQSQEIKVTVREIEEKEKNLKRIKVER